MSSFRKSGNHESGIRDHGTKSGVKVLSQVSQCQVKYTVHPNTGYK